MGIITKSFVFVVLSSASWVGASPVRAHYKIRNQEGVASQKILMDVSEGYSLVSQKTSVSKEPKLLRQLPYYIAHGPDDLQWSYEEWEYPSLGSAPQEVRDRMQAIVSLEGDEISTLSEMRVVREQGPKENRINLTILGDGYTLAEKEKFFEDVEWTVKGLFETATFQSYLPLFNVYAVYVPSNMSGVGDGRPKDTAFRLYRSPEGSKRGIMPGNEAALSRAVRLAPATDYPIVIANDDYYGGLGGRWAISTRSRTTGLMVLRHELGHNFGEVGEEYDNGAVYSGANSARSSNVPWKHWLEGSQADVHEAKLVTGDYVWKNLATGAYKASFALPLQTSELILQLSSVGWSTPNDVSVKLNDKPLTLDGVFHADRSFFDVHERNIDPSTRYSLEIKESIADGDNVLGFALAYALPRGYDTTSGKVGAFASYDQYGRKTYRPTHESCLMRDMRRESFCVVDQENMWIKFLNRISLIDSLKWDRARSQVTLATQALGEGLVVEWFFCSTFSCVELVELKNKTSWPVTSATPKGRYRAHVRFESPEVRLQSPTLADEQELTL